MLVARANIDNLVRFKEIYKHATVGIPEWYIGQLLPFATDWLVLDTELTITSIKINSYSSLFLLASDSLELANYLIESVVITPLMTKELNEDESFQRWWFSGDTEFTFKTGACNLEILLSNGTVMITDFFFSILTDNGIILIGDFNDDFNDDFFTEKFIIY